MGPRQYLSHQSGVLLPHPVELLEIKSLLDLICLLLFKLSVQLVYLVVSECIILTSFLISLFTYLLNLMPISINT